MIAQLNWLILNQILSRKINNISIKKIKTKGAVKWEKEPDYFKCENIFIIFLKKNSFIAHCFISKNK